MPRLNKVVKNSCFSINIMDSDNRKYVPRPPVKYPLGGDNLVSQRELYMAITDFDGRKLVAQVTEPVLMANQSIRDALGIDQLSYNSHPTL